MTSTVLGIDTATPDVAVAVTRASECLAEQLIPPLPGERPRHSVALLAAIDEVVAEAGGWDDVGRIAVGVGPGSFTGLRIGIATARALAQGRRLTLTGVGSLAALARGIGEPDERSRASRLAVIDARRGEAFASLDGAAGEAVWGPVVVAPEKLPELIDDVHRPVLAAGDGALRFRQELEVGHVEVLPPADPAHRLSARHVCLLSANPGAAGTEVRPVYLRQPDAKLWRERDLGNP
jgi:tRNA threonylcarbamoyladenosine biosynthesis protein TsaB